MLLLFCALTSGQELSVRRMGGPDDWTHHRLFFSDPGTAEDAIRSGTYSHWQKIVNDPRYILQREKRNAAAKDNLKLDRFFQPGETQQIRRRE